MGRLLASPWGRVASWENHVLSGLILSVGLSTYFFHAYMAWSMARIAFMAVVMVLAVALGISVHNDLRSEAPLRQLSVPYDEDKLVSFSKTVAMMVSNSVERFNDLLAWRNTIQSVRAMAFAWLAARYSALFAPKWLMLGTSSHEKHLVFCFFAISSR